MAAGGGIGWHAYLSLSAALQSTVTHAHAHASALDAVPHAFGQLHPEMMHPAAVAIAVSSVVLKEVLFRATLKVATRANSSLLVANAWHHRSDALSSVVALGTC